jgi:predicted aspartyl protease
MPNLLRAFVAFLVLLAVRSSAWASDDLPVLRANSPQVDVQDGARHYPHGWEVSPDAPLDIYEADRTTGPKTIVFTSDVDRIAFDVLPGKTYDFVILLNGKDSCHTRISTMRQTFQRTTEANGPAVIPFTMDRGRMFVATSINGSQPIKLLFDTGANAILLSATAVDRGVSITASGTGTNSGLGGQHTVSTSVGNTVEIAGLRWKQEPILLTDRSTSAVEGVLGMHMFEGKVVEFDYDRSALIIHDSLPAPLDGFTRVELGRAGPLPTIPVTFHTGSTTVEGSVIIDSGATGALFARREFAERLGLYGTMEKIGTGRQTGTGAGSITSDLVLLPTMTIGETNLKDVPIFLETASNEQVAGSGAVLGMDVLSRFSMLIDLPNNTTYLKPNTTINASFPRRTSGLPVAVIAGISTAIAGSFIAIFLRSRSRKARAPGT